MRSLAAKSLWLEQRSRPDMGLAVGYHCTRIKKATEHDWNKLGHLTKYVDAEILATHYRHRRRQDDHIDRRISHGTRRRKRTFRPIRDDGKRRIN